MTTDQPQEPYTRVPNALLEAVAMLPDAECRVVLVIVRRTLGWQKTCETISLKEFRDATGLSRQGVINGIEAAIKRGIITRTVTGYNNGFCYQVVHEVDHLQVVHEVDQSTKLTTSSPRSRPLVVHEVDYLHSDLPQQEAVNEVPKERKERKDNILRTSRKRAAAPPTPAPIRTALADVCAIDMHYGPKEPVLQVNTVAGRLWTAAQGKGASEQQAVEGIHTTAAYCRRQVYPYKDGQPLTPAAIHKHWRAAIQDRDKQRARASPNGHAPPSLIPPAEIADNAEVARLFRESKQSP